MSRGGGNLQTFNKREPSGPPFVAGAAANGLSVDPVTGKIVFGNDFGLNTAALLSTRQIPLNGNFIVFTDNGVFSQTSIIKDRISIIDSLSGHSIGLDVNPAGDPFYNVFDGVVSAQLSSKGLTASEKILPKAASPVAVSETVDRNAMFTNQGAAALIVFNLPAATMAAGLSYTFIVQNAFGIQINAGAAKTIRVGVNVTAAAGNISSLVIGSVVKLVAINTTEWFAVSDVGSWTVT